VSLLSLRQAGSQHSFTVLNLHTGLQHFVKTLVLSVGQLEKVIGFVKNISVSWKPSLLYPK
jgi:hypothetical protein